jgi:hypothetical protein
MWWPSTGKLIELIRLKAKGEKIKDKGKIKNRSVGSDKRQVQGIRR